MAHAAQPHGPDSPNRDKDIPPIAIKQMSWLIYEMASRKHRRAGAGLPDGCLFVVFDRREEAACRLQEAGCRFGFLV